jgi:hypothetical protein
MYENPFKKFFNKDKISNETVSVSVIENAVNPLPDDIVAYLRHEKSVEWLKSNPELKLSEVKPEEDMDEVEYEDFCLRNGITPSREPSKYEYIYKKQ